MTEVTSLSLPKDKNLEKGTPIVLSAYVGRWNTGYAETAKLMEDLKREGVLKNAYKLRCPHCRAPVGEMIDTFNEIPVENVTCEKCGTEFIPLENCMIFYRKL